jgi:hypothetical protein
MGDGYTPEPDAFRSDDDSGETDADGAGPGGSRERPSEPGFGPAAAPDAPAADSTEPPPRTFGRRGWLLVAAIAVCFLLIPAVILAYPYVGQQLGLPFYDTYLVLPLLPAVLLAVLAVWATTRP